VQDEAFGPDSILPVKVFLKVSYLTHFCSSGRGVRALTVAELATVVFGIPSQFVPFFDFYHLQCLPIKVFDALFLAWSKATLLPTRKIQKVEYYFFTPAAVLEDSTPLFIQSIQKNIASLLVVFFLILPTRLQERLTMPLFKSQCGIILS